LENVRLKKAEDSKKAVEQKLKEQEEKYEKMITNLKKQIDDLKRESQQSFDADTFSQPLKKADTTRAARNTNSQTKSSRQPVANNPIEERDLNSRSRREGFGESPFFTRNNASRSRSPIQEHPGQRQSYMSQGELYDERDGDRFAFSAAKGGVYNQPVSTLRNRSNLISEEPNKVIMNILDPMAPPDLLSQENAQVMDMPVREFRERESVREEKRLPLLQQSEGASNYDNLKAESKNEG